MFEVRICTGRNEYKTYHKVFAFWSNDGKTYTIEFYDAQNRVSAECFKCTDLHDSGFSARGDCLAFRT